MKRQLMVFAPLLAIAWPPTSLHAQTTQSTQIMVRVTAHDAKIIGSGVGGARITIIENETGDTLAVGVQKGSTGNTELIMREPRVRGATVYDTPGAAGFLATLSLTSPTVITVIGEGPLGTPHAIQRTSKTMLVVPGQHVLGDGVILDLLGYTVVAELPTAITAGQSFQVGANVTMLCGCPTEPGGLWDADAMTVVVMIDRNGRTVQEVEMPFAGTTSNYGATVTVNEPGSYTLVVIAMNRATGNFGMEKTRVSIDP